MFDGFRFFSSYAGSSLSEWPVQSSPFSSDQTGSDRSSHRHGHSAKGDLPSNERLNSEVSAVNNCFVVSSFWLPTKARISCVSAPLPPWAESQWLSRTSTLTATPLSSPKITPSISAMNQMRCTGPSQLYSGRERLGLVWTWDF